MHAIDIIGGGPAGAAAALAAAREGACVHLHEKSRFPRHKVCGEFLSPEIVPLLENLCVWDDFESARPARIRRLVLRFPSREKRCTLPEAAYGLSRYALDDLLYRRARQTIGACDLPPGRRVIAHGRKAIAPRGRRLFGFKAHFEGPSDDAVELYFFGRVYVGLNTVENGVTNVCGLAPEALLRERRFEIDELIAGFGPLRERIGPLRRSMDWLMTGPLVFENRFSRPGADYLAGDALSFVDPFTGSGIVSAVLTGSLAGEAAASGMPVDEYVRRCRSRLQRPFLMSSLFRAAVVRGWAEYLAPFVPGGWLVRLTRPA